MKLLGVDAGQSGAIALLNTETGEVEIEDTEIEFDGTLNCSWFFAKLTEWEPDAAIIEGVFKPNSLVQQKGEFLACCKLFQLPLTVVAISTWKKAMLGSNTKDKKVSINKCCELYPTAQINRATPAGRKMKPDDNRAEAVLLAEYLRRTL